MKSPAGRHATWAAGGVEAAGVDDAGAGTAGVEAADAAAGVPASSPPPHAESAAMANTVETNWKARMDFFIESICGFSRYHRENGFRNSFHITDDGLSPAMR
ncbi:hypothetical protein [Burkholderia plantarii]|uniref:hypothetical protein n=1 Tax=Burkholderia plantarii TaxID=41899 RepID=UPI000A45B5E9|nr:hypothetical protein [Burkholderia plantarii]